jgi:cytochrome o ubiquinol oxidase subunit 2
MSSFWIPNLGGQLYTMTGMVNVLHLIADTPGDYPGSSAEINGSGFSEMKFTAHVGTDEEFGKWINQVRKSPDNLDQDAYAALVKPGLTEKQYYAFADPGLHSTIIKKYMGHSDVHIPKHEASH